MTAINYEKVAELVDSVAEYVDEIEHSKLAAERSARTERVGKLAAQYETSTGESLPEELHDKLANLDQQTLDHLLKVANNSEDSPESLGGPAEINDRREPQTTKEAAAQAEEQFVDWIING
jgi:hemerythrin-like domain-containing protein